MSLSSALFFLTLLSKMSTLGSNSILGAGEKHTQDDPPNSIQPSTPTVDSMSEILAWSLNKPMPCNLSESYAEMGMPPSPTIPSIILPSEQQMEEGYDTDGTRGPFYNGVEYDGDPLLLKKSQK